MRVAIVLERTESWRGGAETSIQQYGLALAKRGIEVHLVTATRGHSAGPLQYETVSAPGPTLLARTLGFVRHAARFCREHRFDVVHAVTPVPGVDVYQPRGGTVIETQRRNVAVRSSCGTRGVKRVTNAVNVKQRLLRRLERKLLGGQPPPLVVAVSQYVARQLRDDYGVDPTRIRVVFNGVDLEHLERTDGPRARAEVRRTYRLPPNAVVMLAVAHNFKLKGLASLIRALALLSVRADLPEVRVLVVGRDNPVRYQRLAEKLGVSNRLVFAGPTERVGWFYSAADVLVHPTFYDPCSRVVLEALAMGVPCITTKHNGAAEVMQDGKEGFVIDSAQDVAALADRMARLCDPGFRAECAARAVAVRSKVDMNRHVAEMLAVYESIGRTPG